HRGSIGISSSHEKSWDLSRAGDAAPRRDRDHGRLGCDLYRGFRGNGTHFLYRERRGTEKPGYYHLAEVTAGGNGYPACRDKARLGESDEGGRNGGNDIVSNVIDRLQGAAKKLDSLHQAHPEEDLS